VNPNIFEPHKNLIDFVQCYWTIESLKEDTPLINTIVPDGTMKMIFHYGDLYWHHPPNGQRFLQPRCFLIGQLTRPYIVEPKGNTGSFVVRFHPHGFLPFTTIPIKEMENTPVALDRLFGEDGTALEQKILRAKKTEERITFIETFLLDRLNSKEVTDRIVQSTIETITTANGQLSVEELSQKSNLNRRQLSRKFSSDIGLSPKQLSKTIRLQATLKMLLNNDGTSLTDLAYENEFYDQAHFIKEFKAFTGLTPKEFYGENLKIVVVPFLQF